MGWTYTEAMYYTDNNKVDRKAECRKLFTCEIGLAKFSVLKDSLRGTTYYAAVERIVKATGERIVFGAVVLTSIDNHSWCNFGYKEMDETMGPCEDDCPKSIIALLTPTDDEWALDWRNRCLSKSGNKPSFAKLPIGTTIEWKSGNITHRAIKMAPAFQFKTPWFKDYENNTYWRKNHISKNWRVVAI